MASKGANGKQGRPVPSGRFSRVWGLGSLAGRIAVNVVSTGASQIVRGEKPAIKDLLLTPANVSRIAERLATMRGAAMKVGQLISMDSGDFLPKQLADILSRLRSDADPMPKEQIDGVLDRAWKRNWKNDLLYFTYSPVAAASIGQVHKVITMEGDMLAVKIQYPGIRQSINSDVENVASLIRMSGLVPPELNISPMLLEAKNQLHQEADYHREATMLNAYSQALGDSDTFIIPKVHQPLSSGDVLAMTYEKGVDIETIASLPQDQKESLVSQLMHLFFRELFEFRLIQSDPNLANYLFQPESGKIVLLDFGATREISKPVADGYLRLLTAAAREDRQMMSAAAMDIGLFSHFHTQQQQALVINIGMTACEAIRAKGAYDFGESDLLARLNDMGTELTYGLHFWHVPPADALFIHRKLGGLFMLARRLNIKMDLRAIAGPWLS